MIASSKSEIRSEMLRRRTAQDVVTCADGSVRVQERFLALEGFRQGRGIALYAPIRGEVETERIFSSARGVHKCVTFPRVRAETRALEFYVVDQWSDLKPGSFGILEPAASGGEALDPGTIDVIAVPGVAFDRHGHRLGYGGGYYDRLLSDPSSRPRCVVGLAFDFQIVEVLPSVASDAPMDWIVTESETFSRHRADVAPAKAGASGARGGT